MIKAILVDDEPLATQLLARKLQVFDEVQVVEVFTNPLHVMENLERLSFNVAFLDIEMPGINGIDLAEEILGVYPQTHIVFITAYRGYAVQAFELNSTDYLVKPLSDSRLEKTITRIKEQMLSTPRIEKTREEPLKIQCFSEFVVYFEQEPVKWKTAKVKELLAFLLAHHQAFIHRDVLIDTLWPHTEYAKAKIQLHTALSHLRKVLDTMGYQKVITFANQSYCLELTNFQCDGMKIKELYEDYPVVNVENIERFERIVTQYQGDYLEVEGYDWSSTHAETLRQQTLQLLERMIDYYESIGEYTHVQHALEQSLQLDPYSEQILQRLLTHYISVCHRTEAIRVYQNFKERLDEELGISPSHSTRALYNQALITK